jgi:DNA polymerase-4
VGIATNRSLAKLGAGLHKPDGLDIITHKNLREIYSSIKLIDICGIAEKNIARLNSYGIFTPLQFLDAPEDVLRKVFGGMVGYYWYMRLRGWEIDDVDYGRKSFGQQYALQKFTNDPQELARLLMKLCEKMGRRLRADQSAAQGVHLSVVYKDYMHWHRGKKFDDQLYTTAELFKKAIWLMNKRPYQDKVVTKLAVSCFDLISSENAQMDLFDTPVDKRRKVSDACDMINDKYGEFVITPALMMDMDDTILDRIAFGRIRELEKIESI